MNQYDINVSKVMDYLEEHNYGSSSRSLHKVCYERFKTYLGENRLGYSPKDANEWLESGRDDWNYRCYTGYKHCLGQLEDIYRNGQISLDHVATQIPDYYLLCDTLKAEINEYLDYALCIGVKESGIPRRRIACSRFMIYLQKHNIKDISEINYDVILSFYREDYHRTYKSKDVYDNLINAMLIYFSSIGRCHIGHALILNKLLIHQVMPNADFVLDSMKELRITPYYNLWTKINDFLNKMRESQYTL